MCTQPDKKIEEYRTYFKDFSDRFSNICRQFAFAEGGIFWILNGEKPEIPIIILLGLIALALFFTFDTLQYYKGMEGYRSLYLQYLNLVKNNPNITYSDVPDEALKEKMDVCYKLKLFFLIISSIILAITFTKSFLCQ